MVPTYPPDLPLVEIKDALTILRSGGVLTSKAALAQDLWWIQGYAQKVMLGDPHPVMGAVTAGHEFDGLEALDKLVKMSESGAITAQAALDWSALAMWAANELMKLLKDWISGEGGATPDGK